ncbi:MAG: type I restriction endonuclease subunit R [Brumimicrobium sp.]|nr:type I restriction endonuclease subunit R [Brumimicrobium sp.]MCO5268961.1 HsdR family type I site-specific deoxyribonuclease [Brumimicrobium sp.]
MQTPSFKEDHISQIPALQMLIKMGYSYLSPTETDELRGNKTTNVLLEDVLRKQLKKINSTRISSTKTSYFTDENIERGIQILKDIPMNDGYISATERVYNLLTLGKALEQSIDGDKKSFTLRYIDWENIENNVFHVTEEFSVMRTTSKEHYRPDLALFVNGIPLVIIECKRPDLKDPIKQAISQHLRNQQEDGIPHLYIYAQLLLGIASQEASYATNATPEKFWSKWRENKNSEVIGTSSATTTEINPKIKQLKNTPLSESDKKHLFSERFNYVRKHFDDLECEEILPTEQDIYLYGLCRPERLLNFVFNFILYDDGRKKAARYQQFFAVKKAMKHLEIIEEGRRKGGVIWHTQGSGKSLTMVMLAQAIVLNKDILNPKIVLVTDRTDLDRQITGTFKKCGKLVENAKTGTRLVELLESSSDAVVTTIINKFITATKKINKPLGNQNIFVLVDEGHRSQHGAFNIEMQKSMPNACYFAFTGTPLFKKEKSTAKRFGGIIDAYTVDQAVKDKAVVPLLYEGRLAYQTVNENPLDTFFGMISEPLTEFQKSDLKKKFARTDHLNAAEQTMRMIAWDISYHFRDNWKGTGFKGQLVCDKKVNAIKYKQILDEIGIVSSEVLISSIDDREGEETVFEKSSKLVNQFWERMMKEHGNPKKYEDNIINRFKHSSDPEIIIVVDKLLTGFDEPKNTVLYLTRNLLGHKLLQAIARVNRVCPDKDFGYIIDYYGVIENLDDALILYSSLDEFDMEDLEGTLINITEEINKLSQRHAELWDIFKTVRNKLDAEAYKVILRDEAIRNVFYDKLREFAQSLKVALSSIDFHNRVDEETRKKYKEDLKMFLDLRSAVIQRYSDTVDYSQYEGQIQKLIDTHITTEKIEVITELVNIFDTEKFKEEIENTVGKVARADKIASRTAKHISEKMEEDPAFYKKFSRLLQDVIDDYTAKRINEIQYLKRVQEIMDNVLSHTDSDIPEVLQNKDVAKAYYGLTMTALEGKTNDLPTLKSISTETALQIENIIYQSIFDNDKLIIDWQTKTNITGKLQIDIGDYLIDEVRDKHSIQLSFGEMDKIAEECIDVAKIRYR